MQFSVPLSRLSGVVQRGNGVTLDGDIVIEKAQKATCTSIAALARLAAPNVPINDSCSASFLWLRMSLETMWKLQSRR